MPQSPLALTPALPSDLLTYILAHQGYQTTLIICQTRSGFLSSLLADIPQPIQQQPPLLPLDEPLHESEGPQQSPSSHTIPLHPLLLPTLHQIATSQNIHLVFIPTVSHLRAYLSAYPGPEDSPSDRQGPEQNFDKPGSSIPLLLVYGIVELHRDTSEWSAQGLGNSVSGLISAAWRSQQRVIIVEKRQEDDFRGVEVHVDEEDDREGQQVEHKPSRQAWEDKVPMLNGSVRRAGFETEDSAWSGRTIEVGRVLARWFKFGKGVWGFD